MSKWKLVKDDTAHWHYEELPDGCCEFLNEEKECLECIKEGEPEADGVVRWHSAFYCPFCRGPGVPVKR